MVTIAKNHYKNHYKGKEIRRTEEICPAFFMPDSLVLPGIAVLKKVLHQIVHNPIYNEGFSVYN